MKIYIPIVLILSLFLAISFAAAIDEKEITMTFNGTSQSELANATSNETINTTNVTSTKANTIVLPDKTVKKANVPVSTGSSKECPCKSRR